MKPKTMQLLKRYYSLVVIGLWGLVCFAFFAFCYPHHLFYQEQNQLFLLSSSYLLTYLSKPAWMACLVGDFLTQLYYYLYVGPLLVTLVLLTLGDVLRRGLEKAGVRQPWAFIVAVVCITIEAFSAMQLGGKLSEIVALTGGATLFWLSCYGKRYARYLTPVLLIATFWLFGVGMWVYIALLMVAVCCDRERRLQIVTVALTVASVALLWLARGIYYMDYGALLTYPTPHQPTMPDFRVERYLAVDDEYRWGHYAKVVSMVEAMDQPEEQITFYYNLANAQMGQLPDKLLTLDHTDLGTFRRIGPSTPISIIKNMNELYFALGDMTFAERAAMMANVFSNDNRNVRMMKRLAETSIVSGDTAVAMKYIRLLQQTLVYRPWADAHDLSKGPINDAALIEKRAYTNKKDALRINDNARMLIMELLDSNPKNILALDYLLCSDLLLKDIESFKADYDRYCMQQGEGRNRAIYQQALMIYLAGTNAPQEQWERYIRDNQQLQQFNAYNNARGSEAFKGTYWYYFDKGQAPRTDY